MKQILFKADNTYAPLVQRILLGLVLSAHGAQKLLGWFGGFGFTASMDYFTQTAHLPWIIGFVVIMIEFFGALAVILGFATRIMGMAISVLTVGIVLSSHAYDNFFMNWFGHQKAEGVEYFILMFALSASLAITGAGKWSVDGVIVKN